MRQVLSCAAWLGKEGTKDDSRRGHAVDGGRPYARGLVAQATAAGTYYCPAVGPRGEGIVPPKGESSTALPRRSVRGALAR